MFSPLPRLKIEQILNDMSTNVKNTTVNNYLKLLKQIYGYAVKLKVISHNPAQDITLLKEIRDKRPRFFTKKEAKKIIEYSNDFYADLWQFFLYTGMQKDEVRLLKWEQINLEKNVIHFHHKGKSRDLPIHLKVKEILTNRTKKTEYVFPNQEGTFYSRDAWNFALKGILKKIRNRECLYSHFSSHFRFLVSYGRN